MTTAVSTPRKAFGSGELFDGWQRCGDRRAHAALVEAYLPLARSLARRYANSSEPLEDLVQVASLGLVKAIHRFDPSRGLAFSSFAVPTIVGELKRHFRDHGWALHVPRGAKELARKISDAEEQITGSTERAPTIGELAQYLELSDKQILDGLLAIRAYETASLDAPRWSGDGLDCTYLNVLGGEDERLELVDEADAIRAAAKQLPSRERQILYLRFSRDLTQMEIAEQIGVSQMHVSRLLRESLARLRELIEDSSSVTLIASQPEGLR